jgi:ABC-type uncharacterized transport system substrate-binding protein
LRALIGLLVGLWCATPSAAEVAVVLSGDAAPYRAARTGLVEGLAARGHHAHSYALEDLRTRDDLSRLSPAAFVAVGSAAAAFLRRHLPAGTLLAYCLVADPDGLGLGGPPRTVGIATEVPLAVQVDLIRQALPATRSVGMLYRDDADGRALRERLRAALPEGWRLAAVAVDHHASVAAAIDALLQRDVDIVWTAADASVYDAGTVRSLLLSALRRRVPVFGFSTPFVRAGAVLGVGFDAHAHGLQAAEVLDRALTARQAGAWEPEGGQVPVFEVSVNLIAAERLGVELTPPVIERASHVFR